MLQSGVVVGH